MVGDVGNVGNASEEVRSKSMGYDSCEFPNFYSSDTGWPLGVSYISLYLESHTMISVPNYDPATQTNIPLFVTPVITKDGRSKSVSLLFFVSTYSLVPAKFQLIPGRCPIPPPPLKVPMEPTDHHE